jgi:hypothetical protein
MVKAIKNMAEYNQINILFFRLLLIMIILTAVLYFYLVNNSVFSVVESNKNEKMLQIINSESQKMENEYFATLGKFDSDYAKQLGFLEQKNKIDYVVKTEVVAKK